MASGYVSGTFSEAEREDYTKVDVDPPSGTEKEMGFQDMQIQESEAILPSPPPEEEPKKTEEVPDWSDDDVEKVVQTEVEELQSSPPLSTEASTTAASSRFQPRLLLTKSLEESSEAEGNPSPLKAPLTPMPKIAEKRTLSERTRKRGGASKKPERRVREGSSQTPIVKAAPPSSPLQSSTSRKASSSPRPPAIKPLNSTASATRQPIRPLSATRVPDPAPAEVASYEEPDWTRIASKEEFLRTVTAELSMDPSSMEGINFHIASYYYVQEDGWTCSHPAQLSSCSLRRDAAESHRWTCWACAHSSKGKLSPLHFFKTSAEQLEHFYLHDSTDAHWAFAKQAAKLGVTANELCIAVIGKDLKISPLPTGQSLELVPKTLPSHPKGHSKLVTRAPWNRTISPWWYESEKGLPWLEGAIHGTKEEEKAESIPTTYFGWTVFAPELLKEHEDIQAIMIHPCKTYDTYQDERIAWHKNTPKLTDFRFVEKIAAIEEHAWYLLLLKAVATKAHGGKLSIDQAKRVYGLIDLHGKDFDKFASEEIRKAGTATGANQMYVQAVANYAISAGRITVPINFWSMPAPPGHPTSFSAVLKDSLKK